MMLERELDPNKIIEVQRFYDILNSSEFILSLPQVSTDLAHNLVLWGETQHYDY